MIIGDPFKFAIFVQRIPEWNYDHSFESGVIMLCIDGKLFPVDEVVNATLVVDVRWLKDNLLNIGTSKDLYFAERKDAYKQIHEITYPSNWEEDESVMNDYHFLISPPSLSDIHCIIFAVRYEKMVRIMGAKLRYIIEEGRSDLSNLDIYETYITEDELNDIISKLKIYQGFE